MTAGPKPTSAPFPVAALGASAGERGGRTPAGALTALAGDADRRRAMEAGFQIHVAKPIDAVQLAAVVNKLASWKDTS
ncbi:MAG: hypothetical protein ACOCXM_09645 [Myxococcota bacterium]